MRWPKSSEHKFYLRVQDDGVALRVIVGSVFRLFTFVFRLDVDG